MTCPLFYGWNDYSLSDDSKAMASLKHCKTEYHFFGPTLLRKTFNH